MKTYGLSEDLKTDLITYINHSSSNFKINEVNTMIHLLETLPEVNIVPNPDLPVTDDIPVVVPEVVSE